MPQKREISELNLRYGTLYYDAFIILKSTWKAEATSLKSWNYLMKKCQMIVADPPRVELYSKYKARLIAQVPL